MCSSLLCCFSYCVCFSLINVLKIRLLCLCVRCKVLWLINCVWFICFLIIVSCISVEW